MKHGDDASTSEVVRESLRESKTCHRLGRMWDEGVASGPCEPGSSMEDIKAEARRRKALA